MRAEERIYLNADKSVALREGDPDAAFLYAAEGDDIPDEAAERFGLKNGRVPRGKKGGQAEGDKSKAPQGNKAQEPGVKVNKASASTKAAGAPQG